MYTISGNMSFVTALVLMLIDGVYAMMLSGIIERHQGENIYQFLRSSFGTFFAKIILICLAVHFALLFADISKGLEFFVAENLYESLSWVVYVLPLMLVLGYMIFRGLRNIARVGEVVCWAIVAGLVYIGLKSVDGVDLGSFLPLFENGVGSLFESGYTYALWFGSASFLMLLFGKIDFKGKRKRSLWFFISLAIGIVQFLYIIFYGLFGRTSPSHNFGIANISLYSAEESSIGELTWLIVAIWIVAQAVQLSLYGWCLKECLMLLFNQRSEKAKLFFVCLIMLMLFGWIYLGKNVIHIEHIFYSHFVSIFTLFTAYLLPLLLLLADRIKHHSARESHSKRSARPCHSKRSARPSHSERTRVYHSEDGVRRICSKNISVDSSR